MDDRGWSGVLRYGLPGLILGLAICKRRWMSGAGFASSGYHTNNGELGEQSRPAAPATDPSGTIAFTTNVAGSTTGAQLLYVIDTKARAFSIYRVDPASNSKGTVKLEAARQYQWDLKLSDYNNLGLVPTEIETAVRAGGPTKR